MVYKLGHNGVQAPGFIRGVLTANCELRTANCTDRYRFDSINHLLNSVNGDTIVPKFILNYFYTSFCE
jgi:phage-related protein